MEKLITYQKYEDGVLSGYIYETFRNEIKIADTPVIRVLVKRKGIPHDKVMFLKSSGKELSINELITLKHENSNDKTDDKDH